MSKQAQTQVQAKQAPQSKVTSTSSRILSEKCGQDRSNNLLEKHNFNNYGQKESYLLPLAKKQLEINKIPPVIHDVLKFGGRPIEPKTRAIVESGFGHDFSQVRIFDSSSTADSIDAVNASKAYTIGSNIVFKSGYYSPKTSQGIHLIAHELTHVIQQNKSGVGGKNVEKEAEINAKQILNGHTVASEAITGTPTGIYGDNGAVDDGELETRTVTITRTQRSLNIEDRELELASDRLSSNTFSNLQREHPEIATAVDSLSSQYRDLIMAVDPILDEAGVYDLDSLSSENFFQRTIRRRVFVYENRIATENLYNPKHLSVWLQKITDALGYLQPLLSALGQIGGDRTNDAEIYEGIRIILVRDANELGQTQFIRSGVRQRRQERLASQEQRRIELTIQYLRDYIRQHWEADMSNVVRGIHSTVVANKLVHDMRLNAEQIRLVFNRLKEQNPQIFEKILFEGYLVRELLDRGMSGLQAYRAQGEGFLSGVSRGERESLLANEPNQRDFNAGEILIAVSGFIAGAFQGVGDSIISNVKGIVELFTRDFWASITDFVTEFLPNFIDNEEFRFQIGQMMGQFNAAEIRRLATASPFEYGRTIGHLFGMALTEIALSFIGLGFVLRAFNGSARLVRLSRPLAQTARRIVSSAVLARGISAAEGIAEGIGALNRRIRQLRRRLPAFTTTERFRRATADLTETEQALQSVIQRTNALEARARRALAAGEEQAAQSSLNELSKATDELEHAIVGNVSPSRVDNTNQPRQNEPLRMQGNSNSSGNSSKPVRQNSSNLDELYQQAEEAQKYLSQATEEIANQLGGEPLIPPTLKGRERTLEKIAADYGDDASRITDLARSSIIFDNPEQIYQTLEILQDNFSVLRIKDRFQNPVNGYRDILLNLEMPNGHIVEMQLHLRSILEVKNGEGHKLYEQVRSIKAFAKAEDRPLTSSEIAQIRESESRMGELYEQAFQQSITEN